jgi:hypothetical protein
MLGGLLISVAALAYGLGWASSTLPNSLLIMPVPLSMIMSVGAFFFGLLFDRFEAIKAMKRVRNLSLELRRTQEALDNLRDRIDHEVNQGRELLRARLDSEIREQVKTELDQAKDKFSIPTLEGRSYGETQAIIYRLLDMQRRKLPLSYRNAGEYDIGRTIYEQVRDRFVTLGYWSWVEGKTPEWTDRGYEYLEWFNKMHANYYDEISEKLQRLESRGKLEEE